jgi:2-keto-4-pentenoate hydratase/2-oxohepta-3-ene-1,7-dioic acid hydratase in catechol pathway
LRPSKIVGIGVNYREHAKEMGKAPPAEPVMFLKAPSALIGNGADIELPTGYEKISYEGELAVVIGKRMKAVAAGDALSYVLGYTCLNDVTVRDLQQRDGQWARAKGFDTFCPVGPRIVGGLKPNQLQIVTRVNGAVKQNSSTEDMIFPVAELLAFVSNVMTLEPGDLLTTGTPPGVGSLYAGDVVEIEIEGIGTLKNPARTRGQDQ